MSNDGAQTQGGLDAYLAQIEGGVDRSDVAARPQRAKTAPGIEPAPASAPAAGAPTEGSYGWWSNVRPESADANGFVRFFETEPVSLSLDHLNDLLCWASENAVSDVFLLAGFQLFMQRHGRLMRLTRRPLEVPEVNELICSIKPGAEATLNAIDEVNSTYVINATRDTRYTFRVNAARCNERNGGDRGLEAVLRPIPKEVPDLAYLNPEPLLLEYGFPSDGVVYMCGTTGSGKSTTLAAMVQHDVRNTERRWLTFEAPVEFPLMAITGMRGMVNQCEVHGKHLKTFAAGIRRALRAKPDVMLIGEARDQETIEAVILAAESGHGCYTTTHSHSVLNVLPRLAAAFSIDVYWSMMVKLIDTSRLLVAQKLVKNPKGGRTALRELLPMPEAFRQQLIDGGPANFARLMKAALEERGISMAKAAAREFAAGNMFESDYKKIVVEIAA